MVVRQLLGKRQETAKKPTLAKTTNIGLDKLGSAVTDTGPEQNWFPTICFSLVCWFHLLLLPYLVLRGLRTGDTIMV